MKNSVAVFWFRRDLRLDDNAALYHALTSGSKVLPVFIFDKAILDLLEDKADRRVHFIHNVLQKIHEKLIKLGSSLVVEYGTPLEVWKKFADVYSISSVYANHDYEPYAKERDESIRRFLESKNIAFNTFKDQVVFEKDEVLKDDRTPYTVWTPYSKKWKERLNDFYLKSYPTEANFGSFQPMQPLPLPALEAIGFKTTEARFPPDHVPDELIQNYSKQRDIPGINGTSRLSVHLRFGTISIRKLIRHARSLSEKFTNELIWREFYQMILWHFPHVVNASFRPEYDLITWRNNEQEYKRWCSGQTGFPIVDAGMRQLNETGYMHNRVRMIVASFLTKDLLIDWRWGESYFAAKLLDFDLASNNGGWQWAAGTGVDAAPYFRIFNPAEQTKKFDPDFTYIKKWVPEFLDPSYPSPMIDHQMARTRTLSAYKIALDQKQK